MFYEKSCGGIVFKEEKDKIKYLVIQHKNGGHWDFPKGHVENGETEKETAMREINEETGLTVNILNGYRHTIQYMPKTGITKDVVFFIAKATSATVKCQEKEISDFRWLDYNTALETLTYFGPKDLLVKANKFLKEHYEKNINCIFCNLAQEDLEDIVYETPHWIVFLARRQDYLGKCTLSLKRHCESMSGLDKDEWDEYKEIIIRMENAVKKAFDATMFNWSCLMNDAFKNNPPNPHIHIHFRPRYNHKVIINGTTFEDKEFAHHYERKKNISTPRELRQEILKRIKEFI